jgi:hypothetical protein
VDYLFGKDVLLFERADLRGDLFAGKIPDHFLELELVVVELEIHFLFLFSNLFFFLEKRPKPLIGPLEVFDKDPGLADERHEV